MPSDVRNHSFMFEISTTACRNRLVNYYNIHIVFTFFRLEALVSLKLCMVLLITD